MKRLWAPWRIKYIQKQKKGCVFCLAFRAKQDKRNYVISRSKFSFSMLNIFPYTNGHIMVAPYRHVKDLDKLKSEELLDLFKVLKVSKFQLDKTLKPHAYNIGINIGKEAGAGFAGHVHIHIVPRWRGDVNFMPILSDTKVISQSLRELFKRLKKVKKK